MAIAFVGNIEAGSTNGSPITTGALDTTGANFIVAILTAFTTGCTLSDNKGNTWTALTRRGNGQDNNSRIWYCYNATVGTGVKTTDPFDVENGADILTSPSAVGSITPSEDNELIIAGIGTNNVTSGSISVDSGMSVNYKYSVPGGSFAGALAYKIQTTLASINPTFTWSGSQAGGVIASFKAGAGGSPATGFLSTNSRYW